MLGKLVVSLPNLELGAVGGSGCEAELIHRNVAGYVQRLRHQVVRVVRAYLILNIYNDLVRFIRKAGRRVTPEQCDAAELVVVHSRLRAEIQVRSSADIDVLGSLSNPSRKST